MAFTPELKYVEGFKVIGFSQRTKNSDEFNEITAKLPTLWQKFYSSPLANKGNIFEVYSDYESDQHGHYNVTVGITCSDDTNTESTQINEGYYLVFHGEGLMPLTVIETWKQIWAYFEEEKQHQRNFISDFEEYKSADKMAIYIGIKK